ncbi:MAG: baseplate J/gp47 family protein [Candidatus Levybacteria bacterium]|nr:baseplate J/gp47 family protein [Candidatus Levybacteria bacterium]
MKLPIGNVLQKKENSEYFLTLTLRNEKATAVVFENIDGKVKIIGKGHETFKTPIEEVSDEELIKALDRVISDAESTLPDNVESHKTIFGVKQEWVEEGNIKKDYLGKLKKISEELDLKPVGFLIITEAIIHLLQKEEGAPLSAILAEIGESTITVSLAKAGKVIESKTAEIHESKPFTVDALLKHLTTPEILPSRVILFDSGNDDLAQEFLSYKWSKSLPFLHMPQVIPLPVDYDAKAVLSGAASQMGLAIIIDSLDQTFGKSSPVLKSENAMGTIDIDDTKTEEEKTLAEAIKAAQMPKTSGETDGTPSDFFGFVEEEDVKRDSKTAVLEKEEPSLAVEGVPRKVLEEETREIPEELKLKEEGKAELPSKAALLTSGGINVVKSFFKYSKAVGLFSLAFLSRRGKMAIIPIAVIILLVFLFFYWLLGTSATITLGVSAETSEKTQDVAFSEDGTDAGKNILAGQFVTTSEDGKVSTKATGKKETGEKAKGSVTIFNNNDSSRTLTEGTILTSSNNLEFVLDKNVTIASASGDVFSGTEPGKAETTVTASTFGPEYNLPSNTKFSIGGSTSIAGKNDSAFSGGTKKDIKVVDEADLEKLTESITKDLEKKAKESLNGKIGGDSILLPVFVSQEFERKSFSKKEGEETDEVNLTATIKFQAVSYKKADLVEFSKESFQKEMGPNLLIDEGNLEVGVEDIEEDDGKVSAKIKIKATLLPKIDEKALASDVAGKSLSDATNRLKGLPKVESVDVKFSPSIPFFPKRIPMREGKIKFVIEKNG